LLNTAAGTDFNGAWYKCSGLTSFPLLSTAAGTDFSHAWRECSGLTSFPLLNTAAGTHFEAAWSGCKNLKDFPLLNFQNMEEGTDCFADVTLTSALYGKLLDQFAIVNVAPNVTFDGGFSKTTGVIGIQAREKLIKKRGWTIYDGDNPKPKRGQKNKPPAEPQPKPEEANEF
jgi:hypothetical protein